ncbi:MAG: hypothetical protein VX589_08595 [Myxococcota bacterium]|nr:hypothetical protein [Myxococcota bacterium]
MALRPASNHFNDEALVDGGHRRRLSGAMLAGRGNDAYRPAPWSVEHRMASVYGLSPLERTSRPDLRHVTTDAGLKAGLPGAQTRFVAMLLARSVRDMLGANTMFDSG